MQDNYKTQATEQVQLLRTGQVCDALTQHEGEPTAHPRSSRSSTIAVEAARAATASQPTWLAAEAFAARALHHTNLLRKLLRHVRDERSLPPKHSLLCAAPHKPIKKTSSQCKISTQHKPPSPNAGAYLRVISKHTVNQCERAPENLIKE